MSYEETKIHSYPSIYAIGHRAISDLFSEDVLVEEKVDGSQFSFGLVGGEIRMKSKGSAIFSDAPEKMFALAAQTVSALRSQLHPEWVYRCEYLAKPKHNVLCYARVPVQNVILFDVSTGDEVYLSYEDKIAEAQRLGLEFVPRLFSGKVTTPDQLLALLETDSILGGVKIEGVVVKNYARFGIDKKVLMGKFVSEAFKETHNKEWKSANPTISDIVERIISTLRTEARWGKAVQHLRDEGRLEGSPRDIGTLIGEVRHDVLQEEGDFIRAKLYEWSKDRISRACANGLPEWYKEKLLRDSFTEIEAKN